MSMTYSKHFNNKQTSQREPIPGRSDQVKNAAGGFVFELDDFARLSRFLVLGSQGGQFYASEQKYTVENADAVIRCIKADGIETVRRTVEISKAGRAPKNSPAIFALALASTYGDVATKQAAFAALPEVCRIGTHLFEYVECVQGLRGWGSGLRKAVSNWYASKQARDLAMQVTKYQQRNGWSHRDLLRLSHPRFTAGSQHNAIAYWAVKGWPGIGEDPHPEAALQPIWAFEAAKRATSEAQIVRLIHEFRLVRECIPTQFLGSCAVWEALLEEMPVTALLRNLAKMTSIGLLTPFSEATKRATTTLGDTSRLVKGRVHPFSVLVAMRTYGQGKGEKGKLTWSPVQGVVNALDAAFYAAFGAVEPTKQRFMLALDLSASMTWANCAGCPITPREASASLAMVTAAVEPNHIITGFTSTTSGQHGISSLAIHPRQRLDDVTRYIGGCRAGGTDCALPMLCAMEHGWPIDVFVIYTDSETHSGEIHATQALRQYREKTGIPAKLVVCGMTSTKFTVNDVDDRNGLDVVGFDTSTPSAISEFVRGTF